jgi:phosphotransferase family enzyme
MPSSRASRSATRCGRCDRAGVANGSVVVARETWYRSSPAVDLDLDQLTQLIRLAFPGARVIERTPTQGGFANANYRLLLAHIHAITFSEADFLDSELRVAEPASMGRDGLVAFLRLCLLEGRGAQRIEPVLARSLIEFAEREGRILDDWSGDPCLVHSDFGGSNILLRRPGPRWEVASVLDWEFAFSGTPFFDFGNLLRPPLGQRPGFEAAVVAGYREAGGKLPDNWRRMSLLADLFNWADFLNREQTSATIIADATARIEQTMAMW